MGIFLYITTFELNKQQKIAKEVSKIEEKQADRIVIKAKDGSRLVFVKGGILTLPKGFDLFSLKDVKSVKISDFYMDEALVTNHQYVIFLNQVLDRIKVEKNVVKGDGQIWLFLGEVLEQYEPIIYRNGRFYVDNPIHASCPVIRVTAYGAMAYADFYKRRLPSVMEWLYVYLKGGKSQKVSLAPYEVEKAFYPIPVLNYRPNNLGIRCIGGDISEWGLFDDMYVLLGPDVRSHLPRKPWEAFEEVGFRTVIEKRE